MDDNLKFSFYVPNEHVEDTANKFISAQLDQMAEKKCVGHVHLMMLERGSTLITPFVPKNFDVKENYHRIRNDFNNWIDLNIERLENELN